MNLSACKIVTQIYDTTELRKLSASEPGAPQTTAAANTHSLRRAVLDLGPRGCPRTELRRQEFFTENTKQTRQQSFVRADRNQM